MGTPLTDWGYCWRKAVCTETDDSSGTHYSGWSYTTKTRVSQPTSFYSGSHGYSRVNTGGGSTWSKYTLSRYDDFPYIVFSLPTVHTEKTITFTVSADSSSSRTIYIRRITEQVSGNDIPSNTTTNQVSVSTKNGGTYTVDVSTLLDDLEENGNYGLLIYNTPSASNTFRKIVVSNILFNWEDKSATVPTYTATSFDLGTAIGITLSNEDSDVLNTLTYSWGSRTGTIATNVGNTTVTWTPPLSWASDIPDSASETCYIFCSSTLNGTDIGTSETSISLTVPTTAKCAITGVTLEEYNTSVAEQFNAYVQGKSQITVTAATSTASAYGATVSAYSIAINGGTLTDNEETTSPLRTAGANTYTVTITDSRGRTDSYSGSFTVVEYSAPTVSITSASRDTTTATTINIAYAWAISSVSSGNEKAVRIYADDTLEAEITPTTYTGTGTYAITGTTATDNVTVKVEVEDFFTESSYSTVVPFTGNIDIDVADDGSIGLGMEAQENGKLDVGLPAVLHDSLTFSSSSLTAGSVLKLDASKAVETTALKTVGGASLLGTGNINVAPQLLWTNSSPDSAFAAQTVTLDLSGYSFVVIKYRLSTTTQGRKIDWINVGDLSVVMMRSAASTTVYARQASTSTTGVSFGTGYQGSSSGTEYCVPLEIYGM